MKNRIRLAVFASGNGTNAENIVRFFQNNYEIKVELVLTNNPSAGVIQKMNILKVPVFLFDKLMFYQSNSVLNELQKHAIDYIVLAGFLWLVPQSLLNAYPNKIINIHPALLPKYGGKGMYGNKVHKAVIEQNETISGITIHLVNEEYDKGRILFQATCPVLSSSIEDLANRIHSLEYLYYPSTIEAWIKSII